MFTDEDVYIESLVDEAILAKHDPRVLETQYGSKLNITQHIITVNGWEYYVTDNKHSDDIVQCLVVGIEQELGDVSLAEIKPYILTSTTNMQDLLPAPNCKWLD